MNSPNEGFGLGVLEKQTNLSNPDEKPYRQPQTPNKAKVSKGIYSSPKPVTS